MAQHHRLWRVALALAFVSVLSNCAKNDDPIAHLSAEDRIYLFGETDTHVPFLGQPVDAGPLNCYPQRMNQGYVLVDEGKLLYLDSIRPTGIERHKVKAVLKTVAGFEIKAQNGVNAPFDLIIQPLSNNRASISWDGAPPQNYRRCERAGD